MRVNQLCGFDSLSASLFLCIQKLITFLKCISLLAKSQSLQTNQLFDSAFFFFVPSSVADLLEFIVKLRHRYFLSSFLFSPPHQRFVLLPVPTTPTRSTITGTTCLLGLNFKKSSSVNPKLLYFPGPLYGLWEWVWGCWHSVSYFVCPADCSWPCRVIRIHRVHQPPFPRERVPD
jgi:hypothetical protein